VIFYDVHDQQYYTDTSVFTSSVEMCACMYILAVWAAERAQDGHICYYCLRVSVSLCLSFSPFLTDSHIVAQLEAAY